MSRTRESKEPNVEENEGRRHRKLICPWGCRRGEWRVRDRRKERSEGWKVGSRG